MYYLQSAFLRELDLNNCVFLSCNPLVMIVLVCSQALCSTASVLSVVAVFIRISSFTLLDAGEMLSDLTKNDGLFYWFHEC